MDDDNHLRILRHLYELRESDCVRPIDVEYFGLPTDVLGSYIFGLIAAGWCRVCGDGKHKSAHDIPIKITPEGIGKIIHSDLIVSRPY